MKIVSLNEINKSIQNINKLSNSGIYSLYGRGKDHVVITQDVIAPGQTLTDFYNFSHDQLVLEFGNLTIGAGVDLPITDDAQVAFIKVNGTLTVNGHLHMDGRGGSYVGTDGSIITENGMSVFTANNSNRTFDRYPLATVDGNTSCTDYLWANLTNYGSQEIFFNSKVSMAGAGPVGLISERIETEVWVERIPHVDPHDYQIRRGLNWYWNALVGGMAAYEAAVRANSYLDHIDISYVKRGTKATSCLSGGGDYMLLPNPPNGGFICGGCGGGMIGLYSETYSNLGSTFTEGNHIYPLNIHANGGTAYSTTDTSMRGGGCLFIAAKHIVVGPSGSITADGGNGQGLMTLMDRNPYAQQYLYNSGSPTPYASTFSGGAGYAQHFFK